MYRLLISLFAITVTFSLIVTPVSAEEDGTMDMKITRAEKLKAKKVKWKDAVQKHKETREEFKKEAKEDWKEFREDHGSFKNYLSEDLTDDEIQTIRGLWKDAVSGNKRMIKAYLGGDSEYAGIQELIDALTENMKTFFDSLSEYIAEDKIDAYNDFVDGYLNAITESAEKRIAMFENKREKWRAKREERKYNLTEKFVDKVHKLLERFEGDKLIGFIDRASAAIEKKIEQVQGNEKMSDDAKERLVDMLTDLLELILSAGDQETVADDMVIELLEE